MNELVLSYYEKLLGKKIGKRLMRRFKFDFVILFEKGKRNSKTKKKK